MGVVVLVEISWRVALVADIVKQQELPVGGDQMRCVELEGWNFQGERVAFERASAFPHRGLTVIPLRMQPPKRKSRSRSNNRASSPP
jgi:hypothetical protein